MDYQLKNYNQVEHTSYNKIHIPTCPINIIIMLGSLSEFIDVGKKFRIATIINNQGQPIKSFSEQKPRNNSLLVYETQDKSIYLRSMNNKEHRKKKQTHKMLREALEVEVGHRKAPQEHWIEGRKIQRETLTHKNQLLRAIVKTKELQELDTKNTLYDKSFARIISAYSKIKTQPIDTLLPPKLGSFEQLPRSEDKTIFHKKAQSLNPKRLVSLENSVKWAKKHGKKVDNFYSELGKSYELIQHERPGKNNYDLQKQMKDKQEQQRRRSHRRKFLKQIERRISKYASYKQDPHREHT